MMLIGSRSTKANLEVIRRIKRTLSEGLSLPEDAVITVTQIACFEEACAPLETVIGLLRPSEAQLQYKIHKATEAINAEDLIKVCKAWGYQIHRAHIDELFKEKK